MDSRMTTSAGGTTEPAVLDRKTLSEIETLCGTRDFVCGLVRQYLTGLDSDLAKALEAARAGNLDMVRKTTHRMKGAAGQIGAFALMAPCARLSHIPENEYSAEGGALLERVNTEAGRVKAALEEYLKA